VQNVDVCPRNAEELIRRASGADGRLLDVMLVSMPYAAVERPSLALGTLAAAMARDGISVRTIHGNLMFAERLGAVRYERLNNSDITMQIGEWTFSEAAFGEAGDTDAYAALLISGGVAPNDLTEWLLDSRAEANAFVAELAEQVVEQRPRIVGCSSVFQQHCASLALLRRVRELDPSIVTMLGGANCEATMGAATHRNFPWVDFVVSGEADGLIARLAHQIRRDGRDVSAADLPYGVLGPRSRDPAAECRTREAPRALISNLDDLPIPDFDDYFEQLALSPLRDKILPSLPVETSRGCWWGAKHHCTFCGLNGVGMTFRAKSEDRAEAEFALLSKRYSLKKFMTVDNILGMKYFARVLPSFAERADTLLFYETKANLSRPQVELLSRAGVRWIQPGIEALHDGLLKLLNKGCSAATNIQLLKWAFNNGIWVMWNHLFGAPGESPEWYDEIAEWLPMVVHLQPPAGGGMTRIRYDRFSPYFNDPARYGLELVPYPAYGHVYPVGKEDLADQAYFFLNAAAGSAMPLRLMTLVCEWADLYWEAPSKPCSIPARSASAPVLAMTDLGSHVEIVDTRPCAVAPSHRLSELESQICRASDAARSREAIVEEVAKLTPEAGEAAIHAACERLIAWKLVANLHGNLLCLAADADAVPHKRFEEFAGGLLLVGGRLRATESDPWKVPVSQMFASA
jgi:ribosomal peptide maturation radical SAM protein 1